MGRKIVNTTLLNKRRMAIAFLIFSIALFGLCIRIGWVQIVRGDEYHTKAIKQQTRDEILKPTRGRILDRNNNELAVSMSGYSVWVRPGDAGWGKTDSEKAENLEENMTKLAKILGEDTEEFLKTVKETKKTNLKVSKFIEDDVAQKIREAELDGVSLMEEVTRSYPMGDFLSHTLGSITADGRGNSGIELQYNQYLSGSKGRLVENADVNGKSLVGGTEKYYESENGNDVVLTIDQVIQNYTEQSVKECIETYKAKRVSCIVMETKTGEILSMASAPSFNPNNASVPTDEEELKEFEKMSNEEQMTYLYEMWRNPLVSDVYEPGSTAKLITTAAALEEGISNKDELFTCTGYYEVNGIKVRCVRWDDPHGHENLYESVSNSCNPVFMQLALRLGKERFYDYQSDFGLTEKTGIDFPGEASPILVPEERATNLDLSIMGFGQTNAMTPIQMITAISSLGNGGNVMEPHLVKEIVDEDGDTIETIEPKVVRKSVSKETADEMCTVMQFVVDSGGAAKAKVPGYRVGGKTGSAQVASEEGGYGSDVIASFVGMAPMDDPDITVLYIVDSAEGGLHGGTVAAPAAGALMEKILKYREIKPIYTEEEQQEATTVETIAVPNVVGKKLSEAKQLLEESGIKYRISPEPKDDKEFEIKDQYPAAGSTMEKTGIVYLYRE